MSVRTSGVSMLAMAAAATMLWSCDGSGSGDGGTPPLAEPPPTETTDVVTIGTIAAFAVQPVQGRVLRYGRSDDTQYSSIATGPGGCEALAG